MIFYVGTIGLLLVDGWIFSSGFTVFFFCTGIWEGWKELHFYSRHPNGVYHAMHPLKNGNIMGNNLVHRDATRGTSSEEPAVRNQPSLGK